MTLKKILQERAEATYAVTEKLFQRVADSELSWSPANGRNWMTVGQLLMHSASYGCGKAIQGFVKGDWGLPGNKNAGDLSAEDHAPPAAAMSSVESVTQALALLAQDRDLALACITDADESDLSGRRIAAPWGGPEGSLFQHLLQMIDHLAQHKSQLFYYLKLMGKDVNTCDLWGM